jgi:hypothetical protein
MFANPCFRYKRHIINKKEIKMFIRLHNLPPQGIGKSREYFNVYGIKKSQVYVDDIEKLSSQAKL